MKVLSGDVGGTSTRLALFEWQEHTPRLVHVETFDSGAFEGLEPVVGTFLGRCAHQCDRACFGLAGPVKGRVMQTTNLPWVVDAGALEAQLGIERVLLINDLEAVGWGLPMLAENDLFVLNGGQQGSAGNVAVIAAGTGLGESGLYWDGSRHRPFASEGGHASFSPTSGEERDLHQYLARRYEHVSWERVVSGPGLVAIYEYVRDGYRRPDPGVDLESDDPAAAIAEAARTGTSEVAEIALRLFVRLYGAEAGNLALKVMATGGVYLAGGIAPKILDWLDDGDFMYGFAAKGRMRPLLEAIPVKVILNDQIALLGAARHAIHCVNRKK